MSKRDSVLLILYVDDMVVAAETEKGARGVCEEINTLFEAR